MFNLKKKIKTLSTTRKDCALAPSIGQPPLRVTNHECLKQPNSTAIWMRVFRLSIY